MSKIVKNKGAQISRDNKEHIMLLELHNNFFVMQCCDCGLRHKVNIYRQDNGDIGFEFLRLDEGEGLPDDATPYTILKSKDEVTGNTDLAEKTRAGE